MVLPEVESAFRLTFSAGEVAILGGGILAALSNYIFIVRRQDRLESRVEIVDTKVEDLRRGRGIILGASDWPYRFRQLFGQVNGSSGDGK